MPWTAGSYKKKHNKNLSPGKAKQAARIANAILQKTGDEGKAIRIANSKVKGKRKKKGK